MFQGFSGATVDFMWGIRFNNEKGWFEAHKEEYLTSVFSLYAGNGTPAR